MNGTARADRRVPAFLGGPLVSELAFRVLLVAFPHGIPREAVFGIVLEVHEDITPGELVEHLAARLDEDEGDVCRALAELERVGLLYTGRGSDE